MQPDTKTFLPPPRNSRRCGHKSERAKKQKSLHTTNVGERCCTIKQTYIATTRQKLRQDCRVSVARAPKPWIVEVWECQTCWSTWPIWKHLSLCQYDLCWWNECPERKAMEESMVQSVVPSQSNITKATILRYTSLGVWKCKNSETSG